MAEDLEPISENNSELTGAKTETVVVIPERTVVVSSTIEIRSGNNASDDIVLKIEKKQ